jgi:hypothetical protein
MMAKIKKHENIGSDGKKYRHTQYMYFCMGCGMDLVHDNEAGLATIKAELDNVQYFRGAAIFYSHGCNAEGEAGKISIQKLGEIVDYAQLIGLDIVSIKELSALLD